MLHLPATERFEMMPLDEGAVVEYDHSYRPPYTYGAHDMLVVPPNKVRIR